MTSCVYLGSMIPEILKINTESNSNIEGVFRSLSNIYDGAFFVKIVILNMNFG